MHGAFKYVSSNKQWSGWNRPFLRQSNRSTPSKARQFKVLPRCVICISKNPAILITDNLTVQANFAFPSKKESFYLQLLLFCYLCIGFFIQVRIPLLALVQHIKFALDLAAIALTIYFCSSWDEVYSMLHCENSITALVTYYPSTFGDDSISNPTITYNNICQPTSKVSQSTCQSHYSFKFTSSLWQMWC